MNQTPAPRRNSLAGWATASVMGMHMISGPIVGVGLGWLADRWLDSWPVGVVIGFFLGLGAGFLNVYRDARRLLRGHADSAGGAELGPDAKID